MSRAASIGRRSATAGVAAPSDRRFRRPEARPGRRRKWAQWAWRVTRVGLPIVAFIAAIAWFGQVVLASRLLAVDRIVVHGTTRLATAEVETLLDGIRGTNLLRVNLEDYRRRALDSPWIADVTLWRVLPSTIEVRVVERIPMAIARLGDHLFLVDRGGIIVDEFGPQYRELELSIVDGLIGSAAPGSSAVSPERASLASRLLDALASAPELRRRVSQIDVAEARNVKVLLDGDSAWLHLGEDAFVERLRSYVELAPALQERLTAIDYVDLRFGPRMFVGSGQGRREVRR